MNPLQLDNAADRHLSRILELQAAQNGATEFLISDHLRVTYAEADDITARLAAGFADMGVARGDRVCMFMSNVPELVLLCLALNKLGAVWVPVCTDYKGEWLLDAIERSCAVALVTDQKHLPDILAIKGALGKAQLILLDGGPDDWPGALSYTQLLNNTPYLFDYTEHDYGDTCAILWTSGTTGRSKGVMQAHNNWIRSTLLGTSLQYTTRLNDIVYCVLPLYNSGAWLTCIVRAMIAGIGCVIEEKFSVSQFMDRIKHFNATQTFAVGAMGVFLMNSPEREDDVDTPLREAAIAPMPPELWEKFEKRFGVRLNRSGLGQSECLLHLNQEHTDIELPTYCLGFPPPDVDVRLFDDDGREVPDGEAGEVCVRPLAPHILFNGYFNDPQATADAFREAWFLTGDMARKDPHTGAFYFVDRKKDAIRFAGRNISTLEVENVVRRHEAVADVAAFGIPSAEIASEDELKLNIVLARGASITPEKICAFINDIAPHFFVPRYMEFVETLPYTPTNKIQKFLLRQQGLNETTWDLKKSTYKVKK
jgi:crotonobetaine/carnitine-CoA ligase